MVSEPAVSETIVFTRVIFRKHRVRKLKKRIKEIELLEQKDKLQKNQQEKVAKKPELQLRLQRLEGEV